ncbi:hypothetical protein OTU49_006705, partial [Cherax quadricarinatus]
GVVYQAVAEDEDLGLTCPLGPGINTRCPCATIHYTIYDSNKEVHSLFDIHDSSGLISLRPGAHLEPGRQYNVEIVASSTNDSTREPDHPMFDVQVLTVVIHRDDTLQDLLHQDMLPDAVPLVKKVVINDMNVADGVKEKDQEPRLQLEANDHYSTGGDTSNKDDHLYHGMSYNFDNDRSKNFGQYQSAGLNDYDSSAGVSLTEPETLDRKKRYAPGPANTVGSANLTLTKTTAPLDPLKPGNTVGYRLDIALPVLTTGIDLVVEIFVMDAVSGITPFALCDVTIIAIGSKISNSSGGALTPASVPINNLLNPNFG